MTKLSDWRSLHDDNVRLQEAIDEAFTPYPVLHYRLSIYVHIAKILLYALSTLMEMRSSVERIANRQ